jgi:hypothetical protein
MKTTRFATAVLAMAGAAGISSAQQRTVGPSTATAARADVSQTVTQLQSDLTGLDRSHQSYREAAEKLSALYADLSRKVQAVVKASGAVAPGKAETAALAGLQAAIKDMQETQASFDQQHLRLQQQMQNENRQFTTLSNVMKTKHDTVKNAISNIR